MALFIGRAAVAWGATAATPDDAAYLRVSNERADKIVATLQLSDETKAMRVRDAIAQQYRALKALHEARDARVKAVKEQGGYDQAARAAALKSAADTTAAELVTLHRAYVARLSAELTPEQVDRVKDGMTYGVLPLTYGVYLRMMPDLSEEQKIQIKAWLIEAREYAMDGGSSDEKHAWFGKYKGRINNYLSAAGYDLKEAEKNLRQAPGAAATAK